MTHPNRVARAAGRGQPAVFKPFVRNPHSTSGLQTRKAFFQQKKIFFEVNYGLIWEQGGRKPMESVQWSACFVQLVSIVCSDYGEAQLAQVQGCTNPYY